MANAQKRANETGDFQLLVLTTAERKREYERFCEIDDLMEHFARDAADELDPPYDLMATKKTKDEWDDMGFAVDEDKYWWEVYQYRSLEEACLKCYRAKSPDEAIWDALAVPRIKVIFPDSVFDTNGDIDEMNKRQSDMMRRRGWAYIGYKMGRDICMDESNMIMGQRIAGGYGGAWEENYHQRRQERWNQLQSQR